jgi:menaquinone-dependent protoporphyrinogen IX oxidase
MDPKEGRMKIVSIALVIALAGGLCAFAASGRGGTAAPAAAQKDVAVVYGSRYGSTAQTAEWIAAGMGGRAAVLAAKDAKDLSGYKHLVLGSGIYGDQLHADMTAFLEKHGEEVKDKLVALFVVCGTPPDQAGGYLDMFAGKCGVKPLLAQVFGGWQKKELLSAEDYAGLEKYYKSVNFPFENYDHTDKDQCVEFGKEVLEKIGKMR